MDTQAYCMPIEHHALLTDQRSMALVNPHGRIVWLCAPRLDASPIFANLLGTEADGYFDVKPADGALPVNQIYRDDVLVLETAFPTFTVLDFFDIPGGDVRPAPGQSELIRVISGSGIAHVIFAPHVDFGRMPTRLEVRPEGLRVAGAPDPIELYAPELNWQIEAAPEHDVAHALVDLSAGPVALELRYGRSGFAPPALPPDERWRRTARYWADWLGGLHLPKVATAAVQRSALLLHALVYEPTGAIAAAATTSLPELIGGVRNWDYRYCWIRDAAIASAALVRLGQARDAVRFIDWLIGVVQDVTAPENLHPLYTVAGGPYVPEAEVSHLLGYANSRPVRVGNAAAVQVQLDVYGPVVDLIALLAERGVTLPPDYWRLVQAMVEAVSRRWNEPDHGIWEIRRAPHNHVHSRVMCWHAVQRGMDLAQKLTGSVPSGWGPLRDNIAADLLTHGLRQDGGGFGLSYEEPYADAAALHVGLCGMLAPDDPRFLATIATVERDLREGPVVHRYHCDDGLPGGEGGFTLCTAWLIHAMLLAGRRNEAEQLFEQMHATFGRLGLATEEYDPKLNMGLGNVPQAYSHAGLIEIALKLA
jgi:trehalose 6-phosphate phosphatase